MGEHYLTRTLGTGLWVAVSAPAPADPPLADPPPMDVSDVPMAGLRELEESGDLDT